MRGRQGGGPGDGDGEQGADLVFGEAGAGEGGGDGLLAELFGDAEPGGVELAPAVHFGVVLKREREVAAVDADPLVETLEEGGAVELGAPVFDELGEDLFLGVVARGEGGGNGGDAGQRVLLGGGGLVGAGWWVLVVGLACGAPLYGCIC